MKKNILKIILVILALAAISVGCYFLFKYLGVTDIDSLQEIINKCGGWGVIVFFLLQTFCTIFLSFVPAASMTFITVGVVLYGANWKTFILCFSSVIASSLIMDLIGRFGGTKLIIKLIGKKDYEKAEKLIEQKGMIYVPIFYLLPFFPDDAICMICGATKIKFWLHIIYIVLCRGIGCATIVFGISFIPKELIDNLKAFNWSYIGDHIWSYILLVVIAVVVVGGLLFIAVMIDKFLTKKLASKDKKAIEEPQNVE